MGGPHAQEEESFPHSSSVWWKQNVCGCHQRASRASARREGGREGGKEWSRASHAGLLMAAARFSSLSGRRMGEPTESFFNALFIEFNSATLRLPPAGQRAQCPFAVIYSGKKGRRKGGTGEVKLAC